MEENIIKEVYQIWQKDIYSDFEAPLDYIFLDKELVEEVCENKNMCNDLNVMSWEYEVRTIKIDIIKNREDMWEDNKVYNYLERKTLLEEDVDY